MEWLKAALGFATGGVSTLVTGLFGSSENGKGVVGQVSDAVDRWIPSDATQQKQSIERLQAGDASQASAREMILKSHDSWFDVFIDAANRSVRPFFTYWALGILIDWWAAPDIDNINPFILNVIWTIVGFWFGGRMLFKDLPKAMIAYQVAKVNRKPKKKKPAPEEDAGLDEDDYNG